jgi:hypothetical protein
MSLSAYGRSVVTEPIRQIKRGALIGFLGENPAGEPHLHFEIRRSDVVNGNMAMRLIRCCYCQKGCRTMFEDFDYKKALGGGGKLIKGVVKAVSPDAGPGVDEAGGGLGDIFKAAGVELTDEEAQPEQHTPTPQPTTQEVERATVRRVWH